MKSRLPFFAEKVNKNCHAEVKKPSLDQSVPNCTKNKMHWWQRFYCCTESEKARGHNGEYYYIPHKKLLGGFRNR